MDNLFAARSQMGMSLAFHIIFAVIGVSLPLMMTIAEWRWRSTGDPAYLLLAKRWAKGTTILFAVGAICPFVEGRVAALATQALVNPMYAVHAMPRLRSISSSPSSVKGPRDTITSAAKGRGASGGSMNRSV